MTPAGPAAAAALSPRRGWARRPGAAGSASTSPARCARSARSAPARRPAACAASDALLERAHRLADRLEAGGVVAQLRALAAGVVDHALGGAVEVERRLEQRPLGGRPGSSPTSPSAPPPVRRDPSPVTLVPPANERCRRTPPGNAGVHHACRPGYDANVVRRKLGRLPRSGAALGGALRGRAAARRARSAASTARRGPETRRSSVRAVGFPAPASSSQMRRWGTPVRSETASCVSWSSSRRSRRATPSARRKRVVSGTAPPSSAAGPVQRRLRRPSRRHDDAQQRSTRLPSTPGRKVLRDPVPRHMREPRCPSASSSLRTRSA